MPIEKATPSPAYFRAFSRDPYAIGELGDNLHNGGKSLGGRLGTALSIGFTMMNDDEDLSDC